MSSSGHELISRSSDSFGKGMPYTSSSDDLNLKENNEFQMDEFSTVFNHNTADLKAVSLETPNVATLAPPEKNIIVRDSKFWLIFLSLCVCSFLSALDLTAVSTVLPEMANEFQSNQYSYVGSAYALTSCAVSPLSMVFSRELTQLSSSSSSPGSVLLLESLEENTQCYRQFHFLLSDLQLLDLPLVCL